MWTIHLLNICNNAFNMNRNTDFGSKVNQHFLLKNAPAAQLDRVPDFGSGGWGFEPSRAYNFVKPFHFRGMAFLFSVSD